MLRKQTLTSNEEKKRKNFKTIPSAKDNQKKEKRNENINTCTPDSKATPFSSIHFLHHTKFTSIKLHPAYRQGRGERSLSNRVDKNVADHRVTINHRCPPSSLRAHLKFMFPLPVSSEANAGREKEKKKKREEKKGREKGETEKATSPPPPPPPFSLDRAKHGNEGRWRPPPSPSPVGSHISSSSWPLKFMSTVVTRFISGREESHGYFYMLFARGCIHPRPGVVNATGCLEREE